MSELYVVKALTDLEPEMLCDWRSRGLVFLVGSYISTLAPTSLPTGGTVCSQLYDLLFGASFPLWLRKDFESIPFEALLSCYPKSDAVQSVIRQMCHSEVPNPVHKILASLLQNGQIKGIITTNYDCAFDVQLKNDPRVVTIFKDDYNPTATIQLTQSTDARAIGTVTDENNHPLEGVHVSVVGYDSEAVTTAATGGFSLPAHRAGGQQVQFIAYKGGQQVQFIAYKEGYATNPPERHQAGDFPITIQAHGGNHPAFQRLPGWAH